jgi:hypothetical protein
MNRDATGEQKVQIAPIAAGVGVAIGSAVFADQVLGVNDAIALAGISYLAALLTYKGAQWRARRRSSSEGTSERDDAPVEGPASDVFEAFLDALHGEH